MLLDEDSEVFELREEVEKLRSLAGQVEKLKDEIRDTHALYSDADAERLRLREEIEKSKDLPARIDVLTRDLDASIASSRTQMVEIIDLRSEHDVLLPLRDAAIMWWRIRRPPDWTEKMHTENPTINMIESGEILVARAVVAALWDLARREHR